MNGTTGQTEQSELIRIGDEVVFEQIFRQFHPMLCRYAHTILKDVEAAEEIVQDVFLKIWEKRESLVITVSVKSYLYRAVHNSCLNLVDKKKKEVRMDEVPLKIVHQSAAPVEDIQTRELEKAIAGALDQLPEQCRKVFELSRFGNMKYREIAEMLGISIKTVENQMGKALRIMREQLATYLTILGPFFFYHLLQLIPVL
ncbi:MAG TPA: RNA polymerase sigma-70 factor [Bacteroidia bacterium]|nr:RNA polymerase sigma-70 factor [Bacteroidia bacterium]